MNYRPRTQSKKFLDGDCPAGVLAIYDSGPKDFDRYTVFYKPSEPITYAEGWIDYRGMSDEPSSPQGFGISGQMRAHQAADYRRRVYHHSAKWSELPEAVKAVVRRDCEEWFNNGS
jgi:hypothetical protein